MSTRTRIILAIVLITMALCTVACDPSTCKQITVTNADYVQCVNALDSTSTAGKVDNNADFFSEFMK